MATALGGLRVVDFSRGFPGTLAAMVLADNGAEVIRVEPPGGDPERAQPAFRMWRRGQQSVTLDLHAPADRERAAGLAATADVVIQNWRPGVADQLGLGYEALAERNPGLIYCAITGFGTRGRYARVKAYEGIVDAIAGRFAPDGQRFGLRGRAGPRFLGAPLTTYGAAQIALHGILAALHVRERYGVGQKVETSLLQAIASYDVWQWMVQWLADEYPERWTVVPSVTQDGAPLSPYFYYLLTAPTQDGRWLQFANVAPHMWRAFIKAMGLDWTHEDPDFAVAPNFQDQDASRRFFGLVIRTLREKTYDEWMEIFVRDDDIAVEMIRTTQEALDHPQMAINRHVVEVDDPDVGRMRQLGPQVTLWETPAVPVRPAPAPGRHDAAGQRAGNGAGARSAPAVAQLPDHPLAGATVVDLGTWFAAPYGPALLAELGARVIKVEPVQGDPMRWSTPIDDTGNLRALQGKESLAVDIRSEQGRQIVHELVRRADMVMCSYRQGVAARLGMDYETLRRINPDVIYTHAVAYGLEGDFPRRPVYGPTPPAVTGEALFQLGEGNLPSTDVPLPDEVMRDVSVKLRQVNPGLGDPTAGLGVATGMLLGLLARDRTGTAQQLMTTMLCSNAYLMSRDFLSYEGKPPPALPDRELYGMGPLYRLYECAEGWVFLASPRQPEWQALCTVLAQAGEGRLELANDARFADPSGRAAHADALAALLAGVFAERAAREWEALLLAEDVACVEVTLEPWSRLIRSPVMHENGFVTEVEHYAHGRHPRLAPLVRLSRTPGVAAAACSVGQHTRTILSELGYTDADVDRLHARGIVQDGAPVRGEPVASVASVGMKETR